MDPLGQEPKITRLNKSIVRGTLQETIVKSQKYEVIDRARTDQILKEHSFQRDNLVDNESVAEIGKLLGADYVCISELIKDEGYLNIECSVISVKTGKVIAAANEFAEKDDPPSIRTAAQELVYRMMDVENPEKASREKAERERDSREKEKSLREQSEREQAEREKNDSEILGVYHGSYSWPIGFGATQEYGVSLTVFMEGKKLKAKYEYYNLPDEQIKRQARWRSLIPGSFFMDVSRASSGEYEFTPTVWIKRPKDHVFLNLRGRFTNGAFAGSIWNDAVTNKAFPIKAAKQEK